MDSPKLFIVILNTNRREDTMDCLASLKRNTYPNTTVLVLDNASTDGSVEAIEAAFPGVQIIHLTENQGYSGNNNVGIQEAMRQGADWVLVLNEDTVLDQRCLEEMVRLGESNPKIGILGPMVYHYDEPEVIQSAGGMLGKRLEARHSGENEVDRGQYPQPRQVEWISGCAILVRRPVIEQVGMLDERFFYYWDETEWCLRAQRHGWQVWHAPQSRLWHKGVQRDYQPGPSVTYYNTRNRFLMLATHHAPLGAWLAAWWETLRPLLSWTIKPKWREKRAHRDAIWQGMVDFLMRRWGAMPARKS